MVDILIFLLTIILYGLFSRRIEKLSITAPIVFVLVGLLLGAIEGEISTFHLESETVLIIGEITLALVLFADASRIKLSSLPGNAALPGRLLGIGMPLTILLGAVVGMLILTDLTLVEAAILATLLAPTDAGLGQAVVSNPRIPIRIRQALNVESGLNDGISVPFLMLFIAIAEAESHLGNFVWIRFAAMQIGVGILVGAVAGLVGGWLIRYAIERKWMSEAFQQLILIALALLSYLLADPLGGNGFIAAFVGGLVVGHFIEHYEETVAKFTEVGSHLLILVMFFILGVNIVLSFEQLKIVHIFYAVLSLTVVRMLPVAISMIRERFQVSTVLFIGWFGPRGLASIVLALVFLEEAADLPGRETILLSVAATVLLSIFAHGITAVPLTERYARSLTNLDEDTPEKKDTTELPIRRGVSTHGIVS